MKNKAITYMLVTVILVFFISYFGVKEIARKNINFADSIVQVEDYAKKGEWQKAHSHAKQVHGKWKKYSLLININYGESEHALFDESLNYSAITSNIKFSTNH